MSLFALSKGLINRMNSLLRQFFWSGSLKKRAIHWANAETLCKPKSLGGLGFRDFHHFNIALLAKQARRLLSQQDALWVKLLKSIYFRKTDFMNAKKHARPSWIWSSLLQARETIKLGAFKVMGDGEPINLSSDPWIPQLPPMSIQVDTGPFEVAADWIREDTREWDRNPISQYCPQYQTELICQIPIGPRGMKDEWKWKYDKEGKFSVKSAYHASRESTTSSAQTGLSFDTSAGWKWIWALNLPPKILFFIWRCCNNTMATKANLLRRQCAPNPICEVCSNYAETLHHCLFSCRAAIRLWNKIFVQDQPLQSGIPFFSWFTALQNEDHGDAKATKIAAYCWNLWKSRNELHFRGSYPTDDHILALINTDFEEWSNLCTSNHTPNLRPNSNPPTLCPPASIQSLTIHCDGSFLHDSQKAAYGMVISNSAGQIVDGKAGTFFCDSPRVSEAKALLEATKMAKSINSNGLFIIFSDCQELVSAINGPKHRWPWECYGFLG
ncbi:Putative ribonuclease H protein At1g65750 [Linum perenne]